MVIEEELENVQVLVGVIDGCGLKKGVAIHVLFSVPLWPRP